MRLFVGFISLLYVTAHAMTTLDIGNVLSRRGLVDEFAEEILSLLKEAATCTACNGVLEVTKAAANLGDDIFVEVIASICKLSKAQDDNVCEGTVRLEGPVIAQSFRTMDIPSRTSQLFCNTIAGLCPFPEVQAPRLSFPSSKPTNLTRPRPSGQTPLKVIHYSDIHVDPFYVTGSGTDCKKPICCRDYGGSFSPNTTQSPAGPFGDHKCDVPRSLEESMYAAIRDIVPDAAFALFTGDIVDHAIWNTTIEQNTLDINDAYSLMTGFGNVYGTIGNHEQSPTNALQPNDLGDKASWLYNLVSGIWTKWIGSASMPTVQDTGFYSSEVPNTNLRIISLNTNLYYKLNFWLYEKTMEQDPNGQFALLIEELTDAETAAERVYIIGHMPPGSSDALHDGSNSLDQIIKRYKDTIAGMFFGHTHKDEFEISYSDYSARTFGNAVAYSYVMPSLTPTDGMPAFRVYSVDPVTYTVLDAETYIADMNDPAFQTTGPVWTKYYSAKETYGPLVSPPPGPKDELTPAFWHNVTEAFKTNDDAFQGYWAKRTRAWNVTTCTGDCKSEAICGLQAGRSQDNCFVPSIGTSFEKRDAGFTHDARHEGHGIHCGGSVMRDIWAAAKGSRR